MGEVGAVANKVRLRVPLELALVEPGGGREDDLGAARGRLVGGCHEAAAARVRADLLGVVVDDVVDGEVFARLPDELERRGVVDPEDPRPAEAAGRPADPGSGEAGVDPVGERELLTPGDESERLLDGDRLGRLLAAEEPARDRAAVRARNEPPEMPADVPAALDEENAVPAPRRPDHDLLAVRGQPGVPVLAGDAHDGEARLGHALFSASARS